MLSKLKNILNKMLVPDSDEQEIELSAPDDKSAQFNLVYKKIDIGVLHVSNGLWSFEYSPEFKEQDKLNPIVGFPDKYKVYQQETLFPYFASRIPSLQRLKIQNLITSKDSTDVVSLLETFGKSVITNPYQLIPQ